MSSASCGINHNLSPTLKMLKELPLASLPVLTGLALVVLLASRLWNRGPSAPGPFLARFSDLWLAYRQNVGKFQEENIELHKKYGIYMPRL